MIEPTLRQLEYLVAIADHGGFHRAAEACHVSQPGLSGQIKELEERLEVQLLERDRRRVLFTPAGRDVLDRARRILRAARELTDAARVHARPFSGTLRLGVIPTVAPYWLPRVLPGFRAAFPALQLRLVEDQTARLVEQLEDGNLDLLLLALEADLGPARTEILVEDPFYVVLPRDHRLAGRKRLREADLRDETVLLLEDGHCLRDQALSACRSAAMTEIGDFRATSLTTLVQMVATGAGITLVPESALEIELRDGDLVALPLQGAHGRPAPRRTLGLAWRRSSPREEEFRALAGPLSGASTSRSRRSG